MRTIGVDLAAASGTTAVAVLDWQDRHLVRASAGTYPDHRDVVSMINASRDSGGEVWVAIDAPFGFPLGFTRAVTELGARNRLDELSAYVWRETEGGELRALMGRRALSGVSSMITPTVLRCAAIVSELVGPEGPIDRIGLASRIIETYPAACLMSWGLLRPDRVSYKQDAHACEKLWKALDNHVGGIDTSTLPHRDQAGLRRGGDRLDAVVCALAAGAVAHEPEAARPDPDSIELAEIEGWIHRPSADSLRAALGAIT